MTTSLRADGLDGVDFGRIHDIFEEETGLFHNLVAAAGLDPGSDFRDRSLVGFDFTGADLRGFNFRGSDLRKTNLHLCKRFDLTTIVDEETIVGAEAIEIYKELLADGCNKKAQPANGMENKLQELYSRLFSLQKEWGPQSSNTLNQLVADIANQYNVMVTAIIAHSDRLLSSSLPRSDPAFSDIRQIKETANRAAGLTRQLLAFSRSQTLRPQVLQLGDALSEMQNLLRRVVGEKNELELRLRRDLWFVKADITQFEQVVINIVVNARDALPESGGKVQVCTRNIGASECAGFGKAALPPADYVLVEVEDTGSGIPADVKEKIFEPFFTTKEIGKGTGLGLPTVFGIIKQSGGFIFFDSEVGRGTVFRIFLPRYIPEGKEEPQKKANGAKPETDYAGQGMILVVRDENAERAIPERTLESHGFTLLEARPGEEFLGVLKREGENIRLIIAEGVVDGSTIEAEIRRSGLKSKILIVSGSSIQSGVLAEVLRKPFSTEQLMETIKGYF